MSLYATSWKRALRRALDTTIKMALPPPKLTLSEWANRNLYLSAEDSAEPGKYRSDRAPFQAGMMDAISDPAIEQVVVESSTQVGKTTLIKSIIGYHIDQDPAPILVIQPTLEMADTFSRDRLAPMIRDTPVLRGKVKSPRSRDSANTLRHKAFPGGQITMAGANSPASISARPIRILLFDETDRYPQSVGTEGNPFKLGRKRTTNFWNRKIVLVSSPTDEDTSVIDAAYRASDQRRFHVPCPHCAEFQALKWAQVKWPDGEPDKAYYLCEFCNEVITDGHKQKMLMRGEWRADKPFKKIAGFWINEIYSPWRTFGEMAEEFIDAKRSREDLKVFINTSLAEVFRETYQKADWAGLMLRRENYDSDPLPTRILYLTAGVDVQNDRLEAEIVGWRADRRGDPEESWSAGYHVLYGDPATKAPWVLLDALLLERYRTEDGRHLRISAACVDSGGHHTQAVYSFCNPRLARHVYAIRGMAGSKPIWPKKAGKSRQHKGYYVWSIGVDTIKDLLYGRLKIAEPGPGYCHFSADYSEELCRQLCSEKVKTTYTKGQPVRTFVRVDGSRAESLDARVYSIAALYAKYPPWTMLVKSAGLVPHMPKLAIPETSDSVAQPEVMAQQERKKISRAVRFRFGAR